MEKCPNCCLFKSLNDALIQELIDLYEQEIKSQGVFVSTGTTRHSRYIGWYSLEEKSFLPRMAFRLWEFGAWEIHPQNKEYARPISISEDPFANMSQLGNQK